MKTNFIFGIVLLIFLIVFPLLILAVLDDSKIYVSFDDRDLSGNNPTDISGNDETLTNNGADISAVGILKESFDFEQSDNDYVNTSYYLPNDDFSVSFWAKLESNMNGGFFSTHDDTAGSDGTALVFYNNGDYLFVRINGGNNAFSTATDLWGSSEWVHIVFTYDYSIKNASVYLNGTYIESITTSNQPDNSVNKLQIGAKYIDGTDNRMDGLIDEFTVYEKLITQSEITELYNEGNGYNPFGVPILIDDSTYNHTTAINSGNQTAWRTDNSEPSWTEDSTPTVLFDVDISANCSIGLSNLNYSDMVSADATTKCGTTDVTSHSCTVPSSQSISEGQQSIYVSCVGDDALETATSTSGALNIALSYSITTNVVGPNNEVVDDATVWIVRQSTNEVVYSSLVNATGGTKWLTPFVDNFTIYAYNSSTNRANISHYVETG